MYVEASEFRTAIRENEVKIRGESGGDSGKSFDSPRVLHGLVQRGMQVLDKRFHGLFAKKKKERKKIR